MKTVLGRFEGHRSRQAWGKWGTSDPKDPKFGPEFDTDRSLAGGAEQTTVYSLEGGGYLAFSAKAVQQKDRAHISWVVPNWRRLNLKVRADGRSRPAPLAFLSRTVSKGGRSGVGVRLMSRWRRRKSWATSTKVLNVAAGMASGSPGWTFVSGAALLKVPAPTGTTARVQGSRSRVNAA